MFGIGSTELLVILIVALIVLGPKSIPKLASTLGKAMGEFRRVSTEFQRTLNAEAAQEEYDNKRKAETSAAREQASAASPAQESEISPAPSRAEASKSPAEQTTPSAAGTAKASTNAGEQA